MKCDIIHDTGNISASVKYIDNTFTYRIFYIHGIIDKKKFSILYQLSSQQFFTILIKKESISVRTRFRSFLEGIPGHYYFALHLQEFLPSQEYFFDTNDVHLNTTFYCEIGQTFVSLNLMIEPYPGKESKYSHYHVTVNCPMLNIVEIPELDKCAHTKLACHYHESLGTKFANKQTRLKDYGMRIIQLCIFLDNSSKFKLIKHDNKKYINKIDKMNISQKINDLLKLGLINNTTYELLTEIRLVRNAISHEADPEHSLYKYDEEKLIELIKNAEHCLLLINK